MVMIGIDPHKRTHTAVAVGDDEAVLSEQLVHARAGQIDELVAWASEFDESRIWAVESAGGLGCLLAREADFRVASGTGRSSCGQVASCVRRRWRRCKSRPLTMRV
jgi:hypothetical protein